MNVCPNCGYCPHCGRGGRPYAWPRPLPYQRPWRIEITSQLDVNQAVQRARRAVAG